MRWVVRFLAGTSPKHAMVIKKMNEGGDLTNENRDLIIEHRVLPMKTFQKCTRSIIKLQHRNLSR